MVTPVHRFQPIECVAAGQYAHSHGGSQARRNNSGGTELPVRSHAVELDSSVFLDLPLDGSSEAPGRGVPPPIDLDNKHSMCGLRLSFALITAVIGGARFYSEYASTQGIGIGVIYTLFFVLLLSLCAVTLYRSMTRRTITMTSAAATVSSTTAIHISSGQQTLSAPIQVVEEVSLPSQQPLQMPPQLIEPPPPPYHIAILLPQQIRQEDVPPPSYDKAIS